MSSPLDACGPPSSSSAAGMRQGVSVGAERASTLNTVSVSVLVPAYESADTLPRLLKSLAATEAVDFECVVVDDGSKDDTGKVCREFAKGRWLELRYERQRHGGKARAVNRGAGLCRGELVFIVDADDALPRQGLRRLWEAWQGISGEKREAFAGVEGHAVDMATGEIIGSPYPRSLFDSDHLYTRYKLGIKGDKKRAIRRDVLLNHVFPEVEGEDFVPMSWLWDRVGARYMFRYIDTTVYLKEYRECGITASRPAITIRNPQGCLLYYQRALGLIGRDGRLNWWRCLRIAANVVRYSLHASRAPRDELWGGKEYSVLLVAVPVGVVRWMADLLILGMCRAGRKHPRQAWSG